MSTISQFLGVKSTGTAYLGPLQGCNQGLDSHQEAQLGKDMLLGPLRLLAEFTCLHL